MLPQWPPDVSLLKKNVSISCFSRLQTLSVVDTLFQLAKKNVVALVKLGRSSIQRKLLFLSIA